MQCHKQHTKQPAWYKVLLSRKGGKKGRKQKNLRNTIFGKICAQEKSKNNSLKLAEQGDEAENLRGVAFIIQKQTTKFFQNILPSEALRKGNKKCFDFKTMLSF